MLFIKCPYCDEARDETEFFYGGEAQTVRPSANSSDHKWIEYLYFHSNIKGIQHERWQHTYGCGRWFNVVRDTVTSEIFAVYKMNEPKPIIGDGAAP